MSNFIIISSIDWSTHWQMHQQLATQMIQNGDRVLFVENTGVRTLRVSDVSRIWTRIANWLSSTRGFREVEENLVLFSPIFLPFPASRGAKWLNRQLISRLLRAWIRVARFDSPIVITFLPTPLSQSLIEDIDPVLSIYYCVDNISSSSPSAKYLKPYEEALFRSSDMVFVSSHAIEEHAKQFSDNVHFLPSGVDYEKFQNIRDNVDEMPHALSNLSGPVVGYVGAISGVFDQILLQHLAQQLPHVNFVLVGPLYTAVDVLEEEPNIHMPGPCEHGEVPAYIKEFDVTIIPYLITDFTNSVYSCKLNEYLSMGKPVVTTGLKEMYIFNKQHGGVIQVSDSHEKFIENVTDILDGRISVDPHKQIDIAIRNSWNSRFSNILSLINGYLSSSNTSASWRDRITVSRGRFLKRFSIVFILGYMLLFYTPLTWLMSQGLIVSGAPEKADAIVVLGSYGELGWNNHSFQLRIDKALDLHNKGFASYIIVSSGVKHGVHESDMMRALLKDAGISGELILSDFGASSTLSSISRVKAILKDRGWSSVLLLTSKYHMKRALMTWEKNAHEVKVLPVYDSRRMNKIRWTSNLDEIEAVGYEYAAIVHNWINDRI